MDSHSFILWSEIASICPMKEPRFIEVEETLKQNWEPSLHWRFMATKILEDPPNYLVFYWGTSRFGDKISSSSSIQNETLSIRTPVIFSKFGRYFYVPNIYLLKVQKIFRQDDHVPCMKQILATNSSVVVIFDMF